jgi:hypothetical protein
MYFELQYDAPLVWNFFHSRGMQTCTGRTTSRSRPAAGKRDCIPIPCRFGDSYQELVSYKRGNVFQSNILTESQNWPVFATEVNSTISGPPHFPRASAPSGSVVLLAGPVFMREGGSMSFMELHIPSSYSRTEFEITYLAIYNDSDCLDLIQSIPSGVRRNHVTPTSSRSILRISKHELHFRSSSECQLWRVAIEEVLECSADRYMELIGPRDPSRPPRGYRTQLEVVTRDIARR